MLSWEQGQAKRNAGSAMSWVDMIGYVGAAFVLVAYTMKTMIPLRIMAIGSNVAAITYAVVAGLKPILFLHLTLLPLNVYRTYEMVRLLRRVQQASRGDLNIDWLKPFMKSVSHRAGDVLFEKGAHAERLFYILAGEIRLEEIGKRLGPGHLVGEIGVFAPDEKRTQTARCETAVELLWIDQSELAQLCYQNPGIAFHLLRLITARLIENVNSIEASAWRQAS
jgi:hypothetical protein